MKVNVYGLTQATISFNTLGMILRGKYYENPAAFTPGSVAYNVSIENESQSNELRQVANLGLIRLEVIGEAVAEDAPQAVPQAVIKEKVVESPKETKQKSPRRKEAKVKSPVKPKAAESKPKEPNSAVDLEIPRENSEVVVMTSNGPVSKQMVHKFSGEIDENDPRCEKSMKAAKALDDGVDEEDDFDNEEYVDPSERTGSNAVIGTGNGKSSTVQMTNTIFGDRDEPQYLDLGEEDEIMNAFIDEGDVKEEVEASFMDDDANSDEANEEDDLGDAFIEI